MIVLRMDQQSIAPEVWLKSILHWCTFAKERRREADASLCMVYAGYRRARVAFGRSCVIGAVDPVCPI